jgi:hypothetical protein
VGRTSDFHPGNRSSMHLWARVKEIKKKNLKKRYGVS